MTGLALAIVEGALLRSPYQAIIVGSDPIVVLELVPGDDPDSTDPKDEDE
jgi:hypothetical protein